MHFLWTQWLQEEHANVSVPVTNLEQTLQSLNVLNSLIIFESLIFMSLLFYQGVGLEILYSYILNSTNFLQFCLT